MAGIKLIVDTEAVRTRFSLEDLQDVNDAIDSGLVAAHAAFQGALGTAFEENTLTDVFFMDSGADILPSGQFRLRLKQAFVKPGSVTIKYAGTRKDALGASAETMLAEDYHVDMDKGLVFIDSGTYDDQYVVVTYTAGFSTSTGVKPPDWLQEAVMAWIPSALLYASHTTDPDKIIGKAKEIQLLALSMIDRYKRETAFQLLPIY